MECWLAGCKTQEAHGHWVVDRGCSECLAYALTSPELVGQPTPPRPWHHEVCGAHENRPAGDVFCQECFEITNKIEALPVVVPVVLPEPEAKPAKRPRPTGKVRVKKASTRAK